VWPLFSLFKDVDSKQPAAHLLLTLLQKPLVGLWVININMSGVVLQAVLAHGHVCDVLASLQLMLTA
jgi:hypothetical protein